MTRLSLLVVALMILLWIIGCQYFPAVSIEGHIAGRYMLDDSIPVVIVVGAQGDSAHVRTSIDTYVNMRDVYYQASADDDSVIAVHRSGVPSGFYAAQLLDWSDTTGNIPGIIPVLDSVGESSRLDSTRIRFLDSLRREADIVTVGER